MDKSGFLNEGLTRRGFFRVGSMAAGALAVAPFAARGAEAVQKIAGFGEGAGLIGTKVWKPFSERKVRVGIAGHGVCRFGGTFGFQLHPNVEVVAVAELDDACRKELQACTAAKRAYTSAEEMIDTESLRAADGVEAVYIATDAPSHLDLVIRALRHGMHAASAVPALFGDSQVDRAPELVEAVKASGKKYALFETSAFRHDVAVMREIYARGDCGKIVYTEGEYYHFSATTGGVGSYKGWRKNLPPQWYPTHSNGYYTCVTKGWFTHVVCSGVPSLKPGYADRSGQYGNPFASEAAFFQTSEGGTARMNVFYDIPNCCGETGRWWTQRGFTGACLTGEPPPFFKDGKFEKIAYDTSRPAIPPQMFDWSKIPGEMPEFYKQYVDHHGGSHPYLTNDFIEAIILDRPPVVDAACALNTTVSGIYAHRSAMRDGERLAIPHF